jgi:glycosyltransferase involved in cell wall biosynthesis
VFTTVPRVTEIVANAVPTAVPVPASFYSYRARKDAQVLRLVFVGDDRPRKGLLTLLEALPLLGVGFRLDVVGPHERHAARLLAVAADAHGWLPPTRLREVLWSSDVIVAPGSRDLPEDGYGDAGMVDGFPTTAARVAMLTGCCLVGSNPLQDHSMLEPGVDYVEVPERDPAALAEALRMLFSEPERRRKIAACGAHIVRMTCDVSAVVGAKLARMGLSSA